MSAATPGLQRDGSGVHRAHRAEHLLGPVLLGDVCRRARLEHIAVTSGEASPQQSHLGLGVDGEQTPDELGAGKALGLDAGDDEERVRARPRRPAGGRSRSRSPVRPRT